MNIDCTWNRRFCRQVSPLAVGLLVLLHGLPCAPQELPGDGLSALAAPIAAEARRESSSAEDLTSNGDAVSVAPGATITLMDADGPGMVTHFWNTIAAFDPFYGRSVVLRVYYDGNEYPSVQAPLGDFFAVGHGAHRAFVSEPVSVSSDGLARTCYWRLPFREHIRITLSNESSRYPVASFYYYLDWLKLDSLPEDTPYFHAEYRQSMPAAPGAYTILETEGRGHYAGTVYSAEQVEAGWFGEGDDFIYIDGAELPQLKGTGTEDYFNDAWGFREFCTSYHGVTVYEGVLPSDRVTAYRWHVADPIPFERSFRFTIEHRGSVMDETALPEEGKLASSVERPDWLSSVAFWYQSPAKEITAELPPAEQRLAPYRVVPVGRLDYTAEPPETMTRSHVGYTYVTRGGKAKVGFDFEIEEAGRYRLRGLFQDTVVGGTWQASLDGQAIGGPMDMVQRGGGFRWRDLDLHQLDPGMHTLAFKLLSDRSPLRRDTLTEATQFTLEYLVLLRLEDMEGYHRIHDERLKEGK